MNRYDFQGVGMTSQRTRDRMIARLEESGVKDERVLEVIANTPRHLFLDEALAHRAYEDTALPIGYGQTLSQPYIVARMTEILLASAASLANVLEIGTGSGYQSAVLAQFVERLCSVERIKPLQDKAKARLRKLGLHNVHFKHSDGGFGWQEEAPFDAILSAAAPRKVPDALLEQLAPGGVLVIPVGTDKQYLTMVTRHAEDHTFHTQRLESVHFVPLLQGVTR